MGTADTMLGYGMSPGILQQSPKKRIPHEMLLYCFLDTRPSVQFYIAAIADSFRHVYR